MPSRRAELLVAIDGPAGAGKSTVAKILAERLSLKMLDTGAMYRAVALKCLRQAIDLSVIDEHGPDSAPTVDRVVALTASTHLEFGPGDPAPVLLDGEDVSGLIRSLEVSEAASRISVVPGVRRQLAGAQSRIVEPGGFVLEGRDVTTVVAPSADLKVFLTASIEERARRRWLEFRAKGMDVALSKVVLEVVERDWRDYKREDSPLMLAADAHIVESYGKTPDEVAGEVVRLLTPDVR
ncbi:MAG: (d)CMP kinase [Fimbriimonadaceae bacterium]|nr:(d)CMP kinase [Fimbriimonadaceae bacterium]